MASTINETRSNDQVDDITTKSLEIDPLTHSISHSESLQSSSTTNIIINNINRNRKDGSKTHQFLKTIAGVAGNILEWYDFAVFGYFSDVLGRVFFPPNQEGHSAMIESFAVFGLAFLCRPIGGIILGYIGDTYGRKRALEISIFLMAFPTFAMGCLPSYEHVGVWAIVLLTLVRMLQGLSVGGQLVSSLVFTLENNPREKWGLYGSYVMAAANFGTLLGGLMSFSMRRLLTEEQLFSWGWRVPFLSGILVSFCGIYLRYSCEEESIQHHSEASSRNNPILAAFGKGNRRGLLCASLVPMLWSAGFYLSFVWMATFMDSLIDDAVPNAFGVNSASLFLSVCLLFPLAGILSDKIGRRKVMFMGGITMGLLSPLMVIVISQGDAAKAFFCQTIMGISLSLWGAPMCAWLVESFPVSMRLTSVAVGYNIAQAIIGGSSPALATWLVDNYGIHSPGFMISTIACVSLFGLFVAPTQEFHETQIHSLQQTDSDLFLTYDNDDEDENGSFDSVNATEIV